MLAPLLDLALAVADPSGFPTPRTTPDALPIQAARPPAISIPTATSTQAATAAPGLALPTSGPGFGTLILPAAALLALAVAALVATRRKRKASHFVQVLETTSLGPKRTLVVARVGEEILILGASEAGLQLLAARPAPPAQASAPAHLHPVPDPTPERSFSLLSELAGQVEGEDSRPAHGLQALLGRLRGRPPATRPLPESPAFDSLLAESAEDQELRRKLTMGQAGSIR